jgi:hypothetical protein
MEDVVIRTILMLSLALSLPLAHAQKITAPAPAPMSSAPAANANANANGTVLIIPASGEVKMANDEAYLTFVVEEQDRDRAAASSRVNRRMKEGIALIQRLDPQAKLTTSGYFTYPVYPDDGGRTKTQQPVAWRVGQSLTVTTKDLGSLPQTVARAQEKMALQSLHLACPKKHVASWTIKSWKTLINTCTSVSNQWPASWDARQRRLTWSRLILPAAIWRGLIWPAAWKCP